MEIRGRKAVITGAGSGIGRATAVTMGKRGARLFLTDINQQGLTETSDMILRNGGEVCKEKPLDITSYEEVKGFAHQIHQEFGAIDILLNVAGILLMAQIEDMTHKHWEKVINVNLWGPIHCIECFVPEMIRAGKGHVLTVSSGAGLMGFPWNSVYKGSKFAVTGISEVLRYELMKHNIAVSIICPGAVKTGFVENMEVLSGNEAKARKMFSSAAVPPEKIADQIIKAIRTKRFLIIPTFDMKFLFYTKRFAPPLYNVIMKKFFKSFDSSLGESTI